ncbi:hypothetical protein FB45DRAFT_933431 [Roridomyces roridus]|uniref:DUF6534 domain-containing protein n=1 Tax=Roridomyces roridus TaxID=1738132 RepID=A0AAD7BCY6_9AGAR|nr:hypothetical protein FB45DRAFT_933431 [Roridomyces roridus]
MSTPAFDADTTLGALLVGTLVSFALFGIVTTQAYIYFGRFPKDPRGLKAMVAGVWLGEIAHVICIGHALYVMVIKDYAHPERLAQIPRSLYAASFFGGLISSSVQSFFAYRIYILSRSLWIPLICWCMSLFRVLPSNIVAFAYAIHEPTDEFQKKWSWLFDATWAVSAANDILIAASLVYILYRERSQVHKNTAAMVDRLIAWTIETGVVTSVAGVIMLGLFLGLPTSFAYMALFVVMARLFSISLFASLNSRTSLSNQTQTTELSLPTIGTTSAADFHFSSSSSRSVEMNKLTVASIDND